MEAEAKAAQQAGPETVAPPPSTSVPLRFTTLGGLPKPDEKAQQPNNGEALTKTEVTVLAGFLSPGRSTVQSLMDLSDTRIDNLLVAASRLQRKGFVARRGVRITEIGRQAVQSNEDVPENQIEARQIAMRYTPLAIELLKCMKDANGTLSVRGISAAAKCSYVYAVQMITNFEFKGLVTCEAPRSNIKFPYLTKLGNAVLNARLAEPEAGVKDMADARAAAHRERLLEGLGMQILTRLAETNKTGSVAGLSRELKADIRKVDTVCYSLAHAGFTESLSYYVTDAGERALLSSHVVFEHKGKAVAIPKVFIAAIPPEGISKNVLTDVAGSPDRVSYYLEKMLELGLINWNRGLLRSKLPPVMWTKEGLALRTSLLLLRGNAEPSRGMVSVKK